MDKGSVLMLHCRFLHCNCFGTVTNYRLAADCKKRSSENWGGVWSNYGFAVTRHHHLRQSELSCSNWTWGRFTSKSKRLLHSRIRGSREQVTLLKLNFLYLEMTWLNKNLHRNNFNAVFPLLPLILHEIFQFTMIYMLYITCGVMNVLLLFFIIFILSRWKKIFFQFSRSSLFQNAEPGENRMNAKYDLLATRTTNGKLSCRHETATALKISAWLQC